MSQRLPWDDIGTPNLDINRKLAAADMQVPASWGIDREGHKLFVLELAGDHWARYHQNVVSVHGIAIDLRTADNGSQLLVLTLESEQNADLFFALCSSLLSELIAAQSSASAVETVLNHLRRWKAFMSGRNARVLTNEEVRGLFAELWFLLQLVDTALGPKGAVNAWHGPERVQQDFIFRDQAVEVKSLVAADPRTVRISSENQLDSSQPQLYLLVVYVKEAAARAGQSLNQIVSQALARILGTDAAFEFESKLAEFGYVPLQEYDQPTFEVTGTQAYRVQDSFPRITRSALLDGVVRVTYQIELEHLEPFACEYDDVLGSSM